ncbi:MAG: hypothetical protein GX066_09430 [Clostridiaceae bacterium]|nr:hypothetical protein [Clostridiaceae bacterium]
MKQQKWWTNSITYKGVYLPFNIIRKISGNGEGILSVWVRESKIIKTLADFINNLPSFNTKTAGWMFLAFALTQIALALWTKTSDAYYLLWRMLLVVIAVLLILLNRTLKALYEGSSILKWLVSLLKD